jgi:hypothetical protein
MKNIKKMSKNLQINEDWERESLKDFVYLQETQQLLQQTIQRDLNRKPAAIVVIDKYKILERNELKDYALPF